jgi:NADH-quinone oxidoreductase subunit H
MSVADVVGIVLPPFILLNGVLLLITYLTLLERKFAARLQSRVGPYRVGRPHGWLQPIADALKLLLKEDIVPTAADRPVYNLAPIVFLIPAFLMYATIPFAPRLALADLQIGLLFVLAVILIVLVPVVLVGSLRLGDLVAAQDPWWFVTYPVLGQLAFAAFLVAALASENRIPFDIVEAESELVAGFRVEYSGMKFALIQLAEFTHLFGVACLGTLLFLGGWLGPGPAGLGPVWFILKAVALFLLVVWIRWSFIRIRVDQILALSWKVFLPASLALLLAAAVVVVVGGGGAGR